MIGIWPAAAIALLAALVLLGVVANTQIAWIIVLVLALVGGAIWGWPVWSRRAT
jgi:hypothetical protein